MGGPAEDGPGGGPAGVGRTTREAAGGAELGLPVAPSFSC